MPKCTSNVLEGVLRSFQRSRRCTCGFRNVQAGLSLHGRVLRNLDAKARPGEGFPADSMTDVQELKARYFGIERRVVGVCRMVFRDLNADSSSEKESAASWLKSRGDAPRSKDAVGRSRSGGHDYGQRELVILSKRAKGMRGCQVASLRRDSPGVEDREECTSGFFISTRSSWRECSTNAALGIRSRDSGAQANAIRGNGTPW
jgi:hypothetical protein